MKKPKKLSKKRDIDKHLHWHAILAVTLLTITAGLLYKAVELAPEILFERALVNFSIVAAAASLFAGIFNLVGVSAIYSPIATGDATPENQLKTIHKLALSQLMLLLLSLMLLIFLRLN